MSAELLSEDMLMEIFIRLPINSIHRFNAVCMHWQSLLTNPAFRKLWHKRNYLKPSTGLFLDTLVKGGLLPFSTNKPTLRPIICKIIQSCNGLLLLCSGYLNLYPYSYRKYHVYNPTTATRRTLPELGTCYTSHYKIVAMTLAFDPNQSPHYKVICFVQLNNELRGHIYSSVTRTWKFLSEAFFGQVDDEGVYWNGAIHWKDRSLYFDIDNEMFRIRPKLSDVGYRKCGHYFGQSYDRLNSATLRKNKEGLTLDVYELKRDYSEWVLKYHVDFGNQYYKISVLSLVHGLEEGDSFLVLMTGDRTIVRYNLVSKTSEELRVLSGPVTRFQYIESLSSV